MKGGALEVDGPLSLEAELDRLGAGATGPFTIDARAARVVYGADFNKPAGTAAALRGRIAAGEAGALAIEGLELELTNLVARGALRTAPRTELSLAADAFALDGWDDAGSCARHGEADAGGSRSRSSRSSTDPLAVRGEIALDDLVATPPDRAPIALRGAIELLGTELRTRDLVARAAEQPIRVDASVTQLFEAPALRGVVRDQGRRHQRAARRIREATRSAARPARPEGHACAARLRASTSFLDALSGDLALDIEGGRIVGVSLLEAVLGSFGVAHHRGGAPAGRQGLGALHERSSSSRCAARSRSRTAGS